MLIKNLTRKKQRPKVVAFRNNPMGWRFVNLKESIKKAGGHPKCSSKLEAGRGSGKKRSILCQKTENI